jgi:hypothetical protein
MRALRSVAIALAGSTLGGAALFLLAAKYGAVEKRYRCDGEASGRGETDRMTMYIKVQLYRPWIFWSDSSGIVWAEIPNAAPQLYLNVKKVEDQIQFRTDGWEEAGYLSTLSDSVTLARREGDTFRGTCSVVSPEA